MQGMGWLPVDLTSNDPGPSTGVLLARLGCYSCTLCPFRKFFCSLLRLYLCSADLVLMCSLSAMFHSICKWCRPKSVSATSWRSSIQSTSISCDERWIAAVKTRVAFQYPHLAYSHTNGWHSSSYRQFRRVTWYRSLEVCLLFLGCCCPFCLLLTTVWCLENRSFDQSWCWHMVYHIYQHQAPSGSSILYFGGYSHTMWHMQRSKNNFKRLEVFDISLPDDNLAIIADLVIHVGSLSMNVYCQGQNSRIRWTDLSSLCTTKLDPFHFFHPFCF